MGGLFPSTQVIEPRTEWPRFIYPQRPEGVDPFVLRTMEFFGSLYDQPGLTLPDRALLALAAMRMMGPQFAYPMPLYPQVVQNPGLLGGLLGGLGTMLFAPMKGTPFEWLLGRVFPSGQTQQNQPPPPRGGPFSY
jgi:hypothetical protein